MKKKNMKLITVLAPVVIVIVNLIIEILKQF